MFEENPEVPSNPIPEEPIPEGPDQEDRVPDRDDDTMVFYPPPKIDLEPKDDDPELP